MGNKEKQYTSFRYSSLILYAQKAYLNNINVVAMIISKPDFFKAICQLISNKVLAVSVKVFIRNGIKI